MRTQQERETVLARQVYARAQEELRDKLKVENKKLKSRIRHLRGVVKDIAEAKYYYPAKYCLDELERDTKRAARKK